MHIGESQESGFVSSHPRPGTPPPQTHRLRPTQPNLNEWLIGLIIVPIDAVRAGVRKARDLITDVSGASGDPVIASAEVQFHRRGVPDALLRRA
jgi:hypothetical protein